MDRWSYVLETSDGTFKGFLTINKDGMTYTGTVSTEDMTIDLKNLKVEDGILNANFNAEGYTLGIKGTFKEDVFSGELAGPDFTMPFSANKVKE